MPDCKHEMTRLIDNRERNNYRVRRYECATCGVRFSTIEIHVLGGSTDRSDYLDVVADSVLGLLYGLNEHQVSELNQIIAGMTE